MINNDNKCNNNRNNNSTEEIRRITWVGVMVNLLLSVIKFTLGILGNSQAVIADAVHSSSDLSTDFAIILGVKFWEKPPDAKHPYGHKRIEILISAAIGIILLAVAVSIGYNALVTIREEHIVQPGWIAFSGAAISIVIKEILYRKTFVIGKMVKSSALMANAWHHRTDALSSIPVAIAVAAAAINKNWAFLDHVGAFVVSLFIIHAGGKIIRIALVDLIDTGVPEKMKQTIEKIVMDSEGVKDIHAVRTRSIGSGVFVDLHVLIDQDLSIKEGHDIATSVKENLIAKESDILDVVVHIEPYV